jgi:hypothetical protein
MKVNLSIAALMLFGCVLLPSSALAGALVERDTFFFDVENCGIEFVAVEGIVQFNFQLSRNEVHLHSHIRAKGKGVGLDTGTKYEWNDSFEHFIDNLTPGGTVVAHLSQTTALISHGALPNVVFRINAQLVITPDGTTVVDRFEPDGECVP